MQSFIILRLHDNELDDTFGALGPFATQPLATVAAKSILATEYLDHWEVSEYEIDFDFLCIISRADTGSQGLTEDGDEIPSYAHLEFRIVELKAYNQ